MSQTFSAKAVLSAEDRGFTSTFAKAEGLMGRVNGMASSGLGFGVLAGIGQAAFNGLYNGAKNLVGSVIDTGSSFESAASQIAATMGKSKDEISDVIKEAERLGKKTSFTATQAAEGMNILAMAGMDAQQQIGTAANVLNLAAAGAESMDASASQIVGTMKGFSMAMSDANEAAQSSQKIADYLAKGASLAATDVNELGTALSTTAATSASYGQSIEGTEVALLRLAEQNVTGAKAATSLNRAMADIYTPTSNAAKVLDQLGVKAYDSSGKARDFNTVVDELNASMDGMSDSQKNALKNTIFSTFGLQAFNKMCVSSSDTVNKFRDGLEGATGAAAEMAAVQLDNLEGDLTLLGSATDGLKISLFNNVNKPLRAIVQTLTEVTSGFNDWLDTADLGAVAKSAGAVGGSLLAVAAANGVLGNVPGLFHKIDVASTLTMNGLKKAPGALVNVFKSGYAKLPRIVTHELGGLGAVFKNYTDMVKMDIGKGLTEMFPSIGKVAGTAGKAVKGVGKGLKLSANVGVKAMSTMVDALGSVVRVAVMSVGPAAILGVVLAGMGVLYSQFGDQIDGMINTAKTEGPRVIGEFVNGIVSRIPDLVASGAKMLQGILEAINANIPAIFAGGVAILGALVSSVSQNAPQLIPVAVQIIGNLVTGLLNAAPQVIMMGLNLLLSLVQGMLNNLPLIVSTAVGIINTFTNNFATYLPMIIQTGIQILMGLVQGIIAALPSLIVAGIQGITVLINTISQNLPTILAAGVQIVGMLVSGIVQNLPMILSAAATAIMSLVQGIANNLPAILTAGVAIIGQLVAGLVQALPTIVSAGWDLITSLGQGIMEAIPNVVTGAVEGIKGVFGGLWDKLTGESSSGTSQMAANTQADMNTITTSTSNAASSAQASSASINDAFASIGSTLDGSTAQIIQFPTTVSGAFDGLGEVGTSAGTELASGFESSVIELPSIASSNANEVTSAFESGVAPIGNAGAQSMAQYNSALRSGGAQAVGNAKATTTQIVSAMRSGQSGAYSAGSYIGQGLARGLRSQVGPVRSAAAELASAANAAIAAKAKIGSPSKVTTQYGKWYGEGYVIGIDAMRRDAEKAAEKLVSFPSWAMSSTGDVTFGGQELTAEGSYSEQSDIQIVTYTQLDGKTIATSTARYNEAELDRRKKRKERKEGVA